MGSTVAVRMRMLVVVLALLGAACGDGGGGNEEECSRCTVTEDCDGGDECVLAVDGAMRCFDIDQATCTFNRVPVGRAPTPTPSPTSTP